MSYTYEYPRPCVTVDAALFSQTKMGIKILLIERGNEPYKAMWALPGGFVDMDETCETAAVRELEEETGVSGVTLTQFRTYSAVKRDPRHRTITVVYFALVDENRLTATAGDDAADARWFHIQNLPNMAFDHEMIVKELVEACL